jgi:plastocyanin
MLGFLVSTACTTENYGSGPGSSCTPGATQVCLKNSVFTPVLDTIAVGSRVVWVNADGFAHTSTSNAVPASGPTWDKALASGARDSVTFTVAGTYQYYCKIHGTPGSGMRATIVVK